jgi:hypothetical protein
MSVPLDRLYNFLQDICNQDVLIYRFLPHGSRKIGDCGPLQLYSNQNVKMFCHDQETLNYKDYVALSMKPIIGDHLLYSVFDLAVRRGQTISNNFHNQSLLLHSEMHSQDVEWFEQHYSIGVYWWSHAIIARDWFRYAEVDATLTKSKLVQKEFLIYNRAWSGLREYRIKFTELVLARNLQDHCRLTFNPEDDGKHWLKHEFANSAFRPNREDLDQHLCPTTATSAASADYNSLDYIQTAIEVVLETVFDDTKWHLTEKTLRPIACGHPFILVSTPGSLQYLKRYGFQTFGEYIDESYDSIQDPVKRLEAVVKLMQSIANLPDQQLQKLHDQLAVICKYNKDRFFSKEFFNQVVDEFKTNIDHGLSIINN